MMKSGDSTKMFGSPEDIRIHNMEFIVPMDLTIVIIRNHDQALKGLGVKFPEPKIFA